MTPAARRIALQSSARQLHHLMQQATIAAAGIVTALSMAVECPVKEDVIAAHRRAHRMGRPAKIAADTELQAFVNTRLDTHTFDQIAKDVAANFPPERRVSQSAIHRWWQKTRAA